MTANPLPLLDSLDGLDYPVSKDDLIRRAQELGVGTAVLQLLRGLPADRFHSPAEAERAIADLG